jgi:aromatic ring hydroxylase
MCGEQSADKKCMSSIASLAGGLLQSILPTSLLTNNTTASSLASATSSSATQQPDSGQLSPFAQLAGTLQQLLQSNPAEYKQVTQQIATNLQTAAQTATASGNTTAAAQLTQLATDFSNASSSGQLPNLQDLAHAVGGGHHGHHHGGGSSAASGSSSSSSSASSALSGFLASLQANGTQNSSALNAATIIQNTLTSAGITLT